MRLKCFSFARLACRAMALAALTVALCGTARAGNNLVSPVDIPEIDAGSMVAAFTLLSGGLMVLKDRRLRRKAGR